MVSSKKNKDPKEEILENLIYSPEKSEYTIETEKKEIALLKNNVPRRTSPQLPASQRVNREQFNLPRIDSFLKRSQKVCLTSLTDRKKESLRISFLLESKLMEFGIEAKVLKVNYGPIITQYEMKPSAGVKVSKFLSLQEDLALALKAKSIRVQAPIPGKNRIGIEIPNKEKEIICLKNILLSKKGNYKLPIALGENIAGKPILADLANMPHLLISGATGTGKSVCINTIINSLLFNVTPEDVRMIMIDPKKIELSGYSEIPHLIQEIVTSPEDSLVTLNWATKEMDERYHLLQKHKVRDIFSYNSLVKALNQKNSKEEDKLSHLPYIVLIIDEFADLIMTAGKEIERPITRLAQMARAVGIHLILATQRPSTQVITGIIKANFPSRIAFRVSSKIDSRVILDINGAEKLLGRGDMLFLSPTSSNLTRIHGAYISDGEIQAVVEYLKTQPKPKQEINIFTQQEDSSTGDFTFEDALFPQVAKFIIESNTASVSMIQRHFKVGFARAGRLIDLLEQAGFVGPHVGSKPRQVRATQEDLKIYGIIEDN